ncbi:MAG: helix-turn-helix transcriptional regulator [Faecousia sp.]
MELTLGEKIRRLREECEMSQTDLGRAINMTQRKVSYLENDKYEPSVEDITALCRFFHVSADYLLGFPNPLPYPNRSHTDTPFKPTNL